MQSSIASKVKVVSSSINVKPLLGTVLSLNSIVKCPFDLSSVVSDRLSALARHCSGLFL